MQPRDEDVHGLVTLLLGLLLLWIGIAAADDLHLDASEEAWRQAHPVIRLGVDPSYGPYSFVDKQGRVRGVVADLLPLIERQLGIRFDLVSGLSWPQLMQALRARELDAVATVVRLPERESFIAFSDIYLPTPLAIMTRMETPTLGSLEELKRLRLTLVEGYSSSKQLLAQFPDLQPHYVATPLEGLRAVGSGGADAYVGVLGVNSFLAAQNGIGNLKVNAAFDMERNGQRFGVRKDWPQLAGLLDKALAAIPTDRRLAIVQHWLPQQVGTIQWLSRPGYITRLFPWLLGALGLALLGYFVVLVWNRQMQRELARRRTALERAQAIAHLGDWSMDVVNGRVECSDELFRIAGRAPQSIDLDWPALRSWIHPAERERHERYLQRLKASPPKEPLPSLIARLQRPNGESRWLEVTSTVELDGANQPVRFYGTAQDITERHLAQLQLKRREAVLESVFQSLPDLFFLMQADGTILEHHAQHGSDLYVPPETFLGRRMQEVLPANLAEQFLSKLALVRQRHGLVRYEYDLSLTDGDHHFEARLNRLAGGDQLIAVIRDITREYRDHTQLTQSEARYRELMENMSDGFVTLDRDWRYAYVNQRAAELLGRKPGDLMGKNIWAEFPDGVGRPFYHAYHKALAEQVEIQMEEYYPPWDRWFENRIYPTPIGISIFFQDVSVRKRAEIALQQSRDRLEERVKERTAQLAAANQELETFTYSVSHDLKAPLRGIDGYSRLLLEDHADRLDEEGQLFLGNVRQGVAQMNELIEDLLAYSRMERRRLHDQSLDLAEQLHGVLAERQQELAAKGVRMKVDLDALTVHADPEGLTMVLRNLLDNALKFSAASQPPVIEINAVDKGESVILRIEDNGIGFDMRFHDRIFDIFQRLQRAEDYPGTGVGLAIVRKAMQRMGGRVWAESTPGKGASFHLELPR